MERLKRRGINCLQPKRIMISGKTRVQCFDKTGTLTKDGLDFVGFQPAAAGTPLDAPVAAVADLDPATVVALATCHSAEKCADVIVASEVEYKMFGATGWRFASPDGATPVVLESPAGAAYTVLQRNDFCNTRQTQSVVVRGPDGGHDIFAKVRRRGGGADAGAATTPPARGRPFFRRRLPAPPPRPRARPHTPLSPPLVFRARSNPSPPCASRPACPPTRRARRAGMHWKGATCWPWRAVR